MKKKLLLIDGHNLLFRSFFGMPDVFYAENGVKFNAVYGFIKAIDRMIHTLRPNSAIVVFDSEDCGDRKSLDSEYKANRPDYSEMDENECPFSQLGAIYTLLRGTGVPFAEIHGCEADDVIASYALCFSGEYDVTIVSTDRDYWQIISDSVSVMVCSGSEQRLIRPADVYAKFGVYPEAFADFKCLVGDKSDNIVGVRGVGPKKAADLLGRFGTIDGIFENIELIDKKSLREALDESRERMELNRRLIVLSGDAPQPICIDEMHLEYRSPYNMVTAARDAAEAFGANK